MGKYLNMVRQAKETWPSQGPAVERIQTPASGVIAPSSLITWQGSDLTLRHGVVDFLHTDPDGTTWAFCTVPGGSWSAVNVKFAKGATHGSKL